MKNAIIIDEHHGTDHVQIGSTVKVDGTDGIESFTIVGSTEASPREGRISNESPVGRALLGKRKGETRHRARPGRRLLVQDPRNQLAGPGMYWADELAAAVSAGRR